MKMSNEKMREEFEAWASDSTNLWLMPVMLDGEFVDYYDEDTASAFNVWQASRTAQCVEIPTHGEASSFGNYVVFDSDDVRAMLDAAGVRYK